MRGRATAPGAGTVLNALATGVGSAFAIDVSTTATVELSSEATSVSGSIEDAPDADTTLIERCVDAVVDRYAEATFGGTVHTASEVPMAAGLKSSSAAANATVLATLSALDVPVVDGGGGEDGGGSEDGDAPGAITRVDACRLGVAAAREAGVTVTGAFDDASASMLGGVTVTDNATDDLLRRETVDRDVLVWTPPERAYSADADVDRCRQVAPLADLVAELALDGRYATAMTVNGLAFSAALGFPIDPAVDAMPDVDGVSLSGTGPSVVAVGDRTGLDAVADRWSERPGRLLETTTRADGARVLPADD